MGVRHANGIAGGLRLPAMLLVVATVGVLVGGCTSHWPPGVTNAGDVAKLSRDEKSVRVLRNAPEVLPKLTDVKGLEHVLVVGYDRPDGADWQPGLKALASLPRLRQLVFEGLRGVTDDALAELAACTTLEELRIDNSHGFGVRGLGALQNAPRLRVLTIDSAARLNDEAVRAIATLKGLTELSISGEDITDASARSLAQLEYLEELGLGTPRVTDSTLEALARLDNLKELWIGATQCTDAGVKAFQAARPKCMVRR